MSSIISSFYIGATGLNSSSAELGIVGDNIANSNTVGFKASRAAFEDVLAQSFLGGVGQLGGGTRLQAVQKILAQGTLATTGIATDLALEGNGFFVVNGSGGEQLYTRAGQMTVDDAGYLVNLEGLRVQGFEADPNGRVTGGLADINFSAQIAPPQTTSEITLRGNLSADPTVPTFTFDVNNIAATSNFSTSVEVFDSLGNPHQVDVHFNKISDGTWEWHATADGADIDGGTPGTNVEVGTGTMVFDANGNLQDLAGNTIAFDPIGAPTTQTMTLNLGDPINAGGTGNTGIVQQSTTATAMSFVGQDGFGAGELAGVKVDDTGNVVGTFTNGETRTLAQIAVADFEAADQLERIGSNLFRQSATSGDVNIGSAGSGGRGKIVAGALEQSNVDLAGEFVRMIVAQRTFQANSKTIQTADELLGELIQVKR